jgi:hypothetical protein
MQAVRPANCLGGNAPGLSLSLRFASGRPRSRAPKPQKRGRLGLGPTTRDHRFGKLGRDHEQVSGDRKLDSSASIRLPQASQSCSAMTKPPADEQRRAL